MKPIVMAMPVGQRMIREDTPMQDRGKHAALSKAVLDQGGDLLKAHPEVKLCMHLLWTPPPPGHNGTYDQTHTSVVSNNMSSEDMIEFLDMTIPTLLKLRMDLATDPKPFTDLGKPVE